MAFIVAFKQSKIRTPYVSWHVENKLLENSNIFFKSSTSIEM